MSTVAIADLKVYVRNEIASADNTDLQLAADTADSIIYDVTYRLPAVASAASDRTYVPEQDCLLGADILSIDDCTTVVSVTENGTALVHNTDYVKEPVRLTDHAGVARPITQLRRLNGTWYRDRGLGTVVVNATWGWLAIPAAFSTAARVAAKDILTHRDIKFGLIGATEMGAIKARVAPLVADILYPRYVRFDRVGLA